MKCFARRDAHDDGGQNGSRWSRDMETQYGEGAALPNLRGLLEAAARSALGHVESQQPALSLTVNYSCAARVGASHRKKKNTGNLSMFLDERTSSSSQTPE